MRRTLKWMQDQWYCPFATKADGDAEKCGRWCPLHREREDGRPDCAVDRIADALEAMKRDCPATE